MKLKLINIAGLFKHKLKKKPKIAMYTTSIAIVK